MGYGISYLSDGKYDRVKDMINLILIGILGAYCAWVVYRKYTDRKNGKGCCGCGSDCVACKGRKKKK